MSTADVVHLKEVGMLFSDPMVRALLEDRKDQTRRIVTPQPWKNGERWFWQHGKGGSFNADHILAERDVLVKLLEQLAPYRAGDTIWVREAAMLGSVGPGKGEVSVKYRATHEWNNPHNTPLDREIPLDAAQPYSLTRWTPGMYMPRWACRIHLQVLLVQAQRVQEINEGDAMREGIFEVPNERPARFGFDGNAAYFSPISAYQGLWEGLNRERGYGWGKNPWVLVTTFRRLAAE